MPLTYDFHVAEGELEIALQMIPLKDLQDKRWITTLISPYAADVSHLGSHLTVVMVRRGVIVSSNQSGPAPTLATLTEQLWNDYHFEAYGNANDAHMKMPPGRSSTNPQVAAVDRWVEQNSSISFEDPFALSPPTHTSRLPALAHSEPAAPPVVPATPVRKRHGRTRKPLGANASNIDLPGTETLDTSGLDSDGSKLVAPGLSNDLAPSGDTSGTKANGLACTDNDVVSRERVGSGVPEDNQSRPVEGTALSEDSANQKHPNEQSPNLQTNVMQAPRIQSPVMPKSKASSQSDDSIGEPSWLDSVILNPRVATLIDVPGAGHAVQERVRSRREVDTREVKRTMNQQKPASPAGPSSSMATLLKSLESATLRILRLAHQAQGPIKLKMEIGRILIDHQSGSSEFKKKTFSVGEWSSVFPLKEGSRRLATSFTNLQAFPLPPRFGRSCAHICV